MKSNKHTIISPNIESSSIKCANEKNPFYYHGAELIQHYNDTIKKSSISLIQISADDSFSLISTDNTFSENYQRQCKTSLKKKFIPNRAYFAKKG